MKTSIVIGIVVIAIIIGGTLVFSKKADAPQKEALVSSSPVVTQPTTTPVGTPKPAVTQTAQTQPGTYEAYDAAKLVRAETGKVVLFFRAPWCPTCRGLDADIKANNNAIPSGVTILDVDYDTSTALKQKYGVTYQHTLVQVDAQGNQIAKWTGSSSLGDLVRQIK